jgi:hypothetical protein
MESRRMILAGHVAHMGNRTDELRFFVGKPEEKKPHGRLRRWEDNIKLDLH